MRYGLIFGVMPLAFAAGSLIAQEIDHGFCSEAFGILERTVPSTGTLIEQEADFLAAMEEAARVNNGQRYDFGAEMAQRKMIQFEDLYGLLLEQLTELSELTGEYCTGS